jgi:hypothetical protein
MNFDAVVSIESTDEKPQWADRDSSITFRKIICESGKEYSWYSEFDIGDSWQSVKEPTASDECYNVIISHNYEHKPMINIAKGRRTCLHQEINLYMNRNDDWTQD